MTWWDKLLAIVAGACAFYASVLALLPFAARRIDLMFLWPAFKRNARDLEEARYGFIIHMSLDPNWAGFSSAEELGDFVRKNLV